jgi:diguanylate cyclase (GGDEF)-like protein
MKILLVNNAKDTLTSLRGMLTSLGHETVVATNTDDAWAHLEKENIRFIIADCDVEDANDLIERIRKLPEYMYVLMRVEQGKEDIFVKGLYAGADDCITRPESLSELGARLAIGERILRLEDKLANAEKQLKRLSMVDSLTGLMNRHAIYQLTRGELERARRLSSSFSVIMLDLRHFSEINSQYGHLTGDEVLQAVGHAIKERIRPYDTVGRWADDAFLIVLPGIAATDAEKIAKRIVEGIRALSILLPDGEVLHIDARAGVATVSKVSAAAAVLDDIIQKANEALFRAQEEAEGSVEVAWM